MNVAPGASFEAFSPELASGLAGTLGVRIRTGAGATFLARTTAGITADVTVGSTSVYRVTLTAPTTAGQYWILWDNGTTLTDPTELVVTYTAASVSTDNLYITRDQLKATLSISSSTYDDAIDRAISSASRALDQITFRRFYPTVETRYFTPDPCINWFPVTDVVSVSSATVDTGGDQTYATTWVEGTDFFLSPVNAPLVSEPFTRFEIRYRTGRIFPFYVQRGIKLVGTFGWSETPPAIGQFAEILAAKLMRRARDAPFGFFTHGTGEAATRLARTDPDFDSLVGPYIRARTFA